MEEQDVIYKMVLEVLPREKRRKVLQLMREHFPCSKADIEKYIKHAEDEGYPPSSRYTDGLQIYDTLGKHLHHEFVFKTWGNIRRIYKDSKDAYNLKPLKEGRDNKGVKVGNGYSQGVTVRFPKKTRGARTWKAFWELFPQYKGFYTLNEYIQYQNKLYKEKMLLELAKEKENGLDNI